MNHYIVAFFYGFNRQQTLVIAPSEAAARMLFLQENPRLRDYNITSIKLTSKRVHQLAAK